MRLIFAGLAISTAALAAAIVGASMGIRTGSPAGGVSTAGGIVLDDYRFTPNRIDVRVGQPVTIRLVNAGTQVHDLSFQSLHMPGLDGVESILSPGETRQLTLEFHEPGYHTFVCSVPGHSTAGMTGVVFVQP